MLTECKNTSCHLKSWIGALIFVLIIGLFLVFKWKNRKNLADDIQLKNFRQLEETEALNPSTTGILNENYNPKFKLNKFRIEKLRFRKAELQTFQQWNKKTKDEFLNPPLQTYTAQGNKKIKLQNPLFASILSKLHLAKKNQLIETKVAIDGFEKVGLYPYEKNKKSIESIEHDSPIIYPKGLEPTVSHECQEMKSLVPPLPTKIQAEIHVYEEIQHQNFPTKPTQETQDSIQVETHVYKQNQLPALHVEPSQHEIPAKIHVSKKIQHLPLPVVPTQDLMQVQIMGDDFVDVDLHSNNSDNGNDKEIYSQATGFWGCIRKWL
jgi:hypothetical protein